MKQKLRMKRDLAYCWIATFFVRRMAANTVRKADALRDLKRLTEITRSIRSDG